MVQKLSPVCPCYATACDGSFPVTLGLCPGGATVCHGKPGFVPVSQGSAQDIGSVNWYIYGEPRK